MDLTQFILIVLGLISALVVAEATKNATSFGPVSKPIPKERDFTGVHAESNYGSAYDGIETIFIIASVVILLICIGVPICVVMGVGCFASNRNYGYAGGFAPNRNYGYAGAPPYGGYGYQQQPVIMTQPMMQPAPAYYA